MPYWQIGMQANIVSKLIEDLVMDLVRNLVAGQLNWRIQRISRNTTNVSQLQDTNAFVAGPRTTVTNLSVPKLGLIAKRFAVFSTCHNLVSSNRRLSQRQLYYQLVDIFTDQIDLNDTLLDVSATLNIPRYLMNVGTATRGVVAGILCISALEGRSGTDCTCVDTNGWPIPGDIQEILSLRFSSKANYIISAHKFNPLQSSLV